MTESIVRPGNLNHGSYEARRVSPINVFRHFRVFNVLSRDQGRIVSYLFLLASRKPNIALIAWCIVAAVHIQATVGLVPRLTLNVGLFT